MSYLTLDEAAQYATEQKGFKVEPSVLLRSGVLGALPICAAFGAGRMHNAITQREEDLTPCLLIIPPKHLLELETEGVATIHLAHSLDGEKMLFPNKQRTREHLRVMVAHLDKFLEMLIDTTQETNTPAKKSTLPDTSPSGVDWITKALTITYEIALERYQRGEREFSARNISDAVAIKLAKDSTTHGTRGERSAGNIRNMALKGWKFIPPTGTNDTSGTKK